MLGQIPPITRALLLGNGVIFVLQLLLGDIRFLDMMLWPLGEYSARVSAVSVVQVGFLPWQVLTYGFLHGGLTHLFFNMFALWMFGPALEGTWGSKRFMQYYLVCVIGAGLVQLVVATMAVNSGSPPYPTVGASGGIFGVLLAFGMLFPNHRLMLIFPPIPMRARTFVIVYGVLELVMGVTRTQSGVAHFAHLGGMAFGFLMIQYWRGRWPFRRRPRQG
ncbi:MAG: rhomboid family intramembrane serine protease [Lysobacteraceae bacterium]